MALSNINIIELDNGIRLVHRQVRHTMMVHCGLMIDAGTRDETRENNGIAHFIEHAVFKGTEKRKAWHILNRLENVGGELNAYTTREKTCFYSASLRRYTDRSIELLFDIVFKSTFSEKEIEKEKRVILDEIEMYEDTPEESIYDDFYSLIFPEHPLGYNILGTRETVKNFTRKDILDFRKNRYMSGGIVLSVVGNISAARVEKMARAYFEGLPLSEINYKRTPPAVEQPFNREMEKDFAQQHCILGTRAYNRKDPKRYGLLLLSNLLGGPGMSSRLNLSVREKYGYTYNIGSGYSTYNDAGVFSIFLATDEKYLDKCISLVNKELEKLRKTKLGIRQLSTAKTQLMGQVAMAQENHSVIMQSQAKTLLDFGRVFTIKDFFENIEALTADDLLEISNEIFDKEKLSTLIYRSQS